MLTGIPYFTPAYQYEAFRKGILVCDTTLTTVAYVHIGLSVLFIDTPARFISIVTIIAAAVHVKRNTVTDLSPIKRSFLRFSVIMLLIKLLTLLANIVALLAFVLPKGADVAVWVWLRLTAKIVVVLPTLVVPVLMMVLFKPVWFAVKGLFTCRMCRTLAHGEVSTGRIPQKAKKCGP